MVVAQHIKDPDRWQVRDTLRVIGGILLVGGLAIAIAPLLGAGGGKDELVGADTARLLASDHETVRYALFGSAAGLLVLLVSLIVPRDSA